MTVFAVIKHGAIIIVLVYLGLGIVLYSAQRSYLYLPALHDDGSCEELYRTGAKRIIQGETTLYYREGGKTLIVFYHGNGGTACLRSYLAEEFAKQDFSFVFVEYAGYADAHATTKNAILEDVQSANEFIKTLSPEKLVYMSESLGAGPVAYHATLRVPHAIVLISPYTRLSDVAAAHFPFKLYPVGFLLKDNFDTTSLAKYGGEALVIHSMDDDVIPFALGKQVFESIPSDQKELFSLQDVGHNDLMLDREKEILGAIVSFVKGGI